MRHDYERPALIARGCHRCGPAQGLSLRSALLAINKRMAGARVQLFGCCAARTLLRYAGPGSQWNQRERLHFGGLQTAFEESGRDGWQLGNSG